VMIDIKERFLEVALKDLEEREKYMPQCRRKELAEERWEDFVKSFVDSKEVHNYAVGNWFYRG